VLIGFGNEAYSLVPHPPRAIFDGCAGLCRRALGYRKIALDRAYALVTDPELRRTDKVKERAARLRELELSVWDAKSDRLQAIHGSYRILLDG
jgi:hypothetical protein